MANLGKTLAQMGKVAPIFPTKLKKSPFAPEQLRRNV
jgi:hypothetical protein